jgi:hypothetical protein
MSVVGRVGLALAIALVSRWVCAAMACAKCAGTSEENLFLKKRRVGFVLVFPSPSCLEDVHLSAWEIFVSKSSAVLFENQFVLTLWLATAVHTLWH